MIETKVFPIADTLQIEVDVYKKSQVEYELRGLRKFKMPLCKTSDLDVTLKIEASYVGEYETAVLVHFSKNFWVYLIFDTALDTNGILTLYYLSFETLNSKAIRTAVDGAEVEVALMSLRPAIKAKFTKGARDVDWYSVDMVRRIEGNKEEPAAFA